MVQQAVEKPAKRPANSARRPLIWQDGLAEVKETFRRVALVKHTGFSVWEDGRNGPTLERVLRWNRQARNLSQLPRSLRDHIPTKVLKELSVNRSTSGYEKQAHLQNVRGMCRRIQSQKSTIERRKNQNDPLMYPVFVRRPTERQAPLDTRRPLFYTPTPFKLLYHLSSSEHCYYPAPVKRPRSSVDSSYAKLFSRPSSAVKSGEVMVGPPPTRHLSSAPAGGSTGGGAESRPPTRCMNRPALSKTTWMAAAVAGSLSNGSTFSDCVSLDSIWCSSSLGDSDSDAVQQQQQSSRPAVPKLRFDNDISELSYRRPCTANVAVRAEKEATSEQGKRPRSASMATRTRSSRVTFALPAEKHKPSPLPPMRHPAEGGRKVDQEDEDVIIKHSSDPYLDFRASMMDMIRSEGLAYADKELDELFQYYMDLNPKMHHPILSRVIQDIRSELKSSPSASLV